MKMTTLKERYRKGDKVINEGEIGTVKKYLGNQMYLVEFYVPHRKKKGYFESVELHENEMEPCYIVTQNIKYII